MFWKRMFDLVFTVPGILLLTPLMLVIAVWIKMNSSGPVFYRQTRVGRFEKPFQIFKFRTMVVNADKLGTLITVGEDCRITNSGRFLRKYKLDELPQLINVLTGDMSLVGPRPEVPKYVAQYPPEARKIILSVPPGITDLASIEYRDESTILGQAADPEVAYIEKILPVKMAYYQRYVKERSLLFDFRVILMTLQAIWR